MTVIHLSGKPFRMADSYLRRRKQKLRQLILAQDVHTLKTVSRLTNLRTPLADAADRNSFQRIMLNQKTSKAVLRRQRLIVKLSAGRTAKRVNEEVESRLQRQSGLTHGEGLAGEMKPDIGLIPNLNRTSTQTGESILPCILAVSLLAMFFGGCLLILCWAYSLFE